MRLWLILVLVFAVLLGASPACGGDHAPAPSATTEADSHGCHDAPVAHAETADPGGATAADPCPDACPGGEDCVNALAVYAVAAEPPSSAQALTGFARLEAPEARDLGARPAYEPPPPKA